MILYQALGVMPEIKDRLAATAPRLLGRSAVAVRSSSPLGKRSSRTEQFLQGELRAGVATANVVSSQNAVEQFV